MDFMSLTVLFWVMSIPGVNEWRCLWIDLCSKDRKICHEYSVVCLDNSLVLRITPAL